MGLSRRNLFGSGLRRLLPDPDEPNPSPATATPRETLAERRARWQIAAEASDPGTLLEDAHGTLLSTGAWGTGGRVLDAGAGTGRLALLAAERGAQVTACEPAGALAALGRERTAGHTGVRWVEAELDDLPFGEDPFDHALCAFGLTTCVRPRAALAGLARSVVAGGTVMLAAWHPGGTVGSLLKLAERWDPPPPAGDSLIGATRQERLRQDLDHYTDCAEFDLAELSVVFADAEEAADRLISALVPLAAAVQADPGSRRAEVERLLAGAAEEVGGRLLLRARYLVVVARRRTTS